jgi:hypothetical protein
MEGMSEKKRLSGAIKLERKVQPTPREVLVVVSTIFLGGLGILPLLSILDSRVVSLIADILHFLSSSPIRRHVLVRERTHITSL